MWLKRFISIVKDNKAHARTPYSVVRFVHGSGALVLSHVLKPTTREKSEDKPAVVNDT